MAKIFATANPEITDREKKNMERARRIAAQGMVLLENKGVLPLDGDAKRIALYGNGARHTVKGGTGSGDVNSRFSVNVEQGLEAAGFSVTTKAWLDRYDRAVERGRGDYIEGIRRKTAGNLQEATLMLMNEPYQAPAIVPVTEEDIRDSGTDTALYILARNSGEGRDRKAGPGDYELFAQEREALKKLAAGYEKVIVVLNVGGVMDTKFFRETKGIRGLLLMSQAGNVGGYALADVLTGKVTPSGHLTDTWAQDYRDYPGWDTFSYRNGNVEDEYYREGIFVGYRYFDTFGITPAYPFGYGKSYTDFSVRTEQVRAEGGELSVRVKVTNTGKRWSGREVVQVYYSAPRGRLEKPWQELAAYGKTGELAPGESEMLTVSWPLERMASYDSDRASWLLEAGTYYIRVGTHSRDTRVEAALLLEKELVTEVLSHRLAEEAEMGKLNISETTHSYTYPSEEAEKAAAVKLTINTEEMSPRRVHYREKNPETTGKEGKRAAVSPAKNAAENKIKLTDVRAGRAGLEELVAQMTVEELAELCVGTARGGLGGDSVVGAASLACPGAAGDTTSAFIEDRKIPNMVLADGPAGLRLSRYFAADEENNILPGTMEAAFPGIEEVMGAAKRPALPGGAKRYYQYCTAIPIATLLAQTWDVQAIEEAGDIVGGEMRELGVTLWLAPGMNIHRNPLCGRNFEYYSEDPLVSGLCAAADTKGVQKHPGAGTTIKHFAFNNQEDNRMHTNAHVSERAAREIYLKGFEIAVKTAQPLSIMTSYNLVNGTHTANSYDLLTAIARDEWGFQGIIMTDWGTTGSIEMESGKSFKYASSSAAGCIRAGNDLIMPGSQGDIDEIVASVGAKPGSVACPITLGDLQACAKRILSVIMRSEA